MRTIKASEFNAKCLKLMDETAETGEITKHGKPFARLVPNRQRRPSLLGLHKGKTRVFGDIVGPIADLDD